MKDIEIPAELAWLDPKSWPHQSSETGMRQIADHCYSQAQALADLNSDLQQTRQRVQQALTGAAAETADQQLLNGAYRVDTLVGDLRAHGKSAEVSATHIEDAKRKSVTTLAIAANSIFGAVSDWQRTGDPSSLMQIPIIKELAEYSIGKAVSDAGGRIEDTLASKLGSTMMAGPPDAGAVAAAIMGGQFAEGHRIDIGDVLHSALSMGAPGTGDLATLQTSLHPTTGTQPSGIQLAALHNVGAADADAPANGRVPLHMLQEPTIGFGTAGIMPEVNVSVDGGKREAVGFDTGSAGLVLPLTDIPLRDLAHPIGLGFTGYGNSDAQKLELLAKFEAPIEIGDPGHSVTTVPTEVNAPIFTLEMGTGAGGKHPYIDPYFNFPPFDNGHHSDPVGILGVGPSATGPSPHSVLDALPAPYKDGVLIDVPKGYVQFGPDPLPGGYRVDGSPMTTVDVQVDGGAIHHDVPMAFDTGAQYGAIQRSFLPGTEVLHGGNGDSLEVAPAGTEVTVYDHGHKLYSFTTTGSERMQVVSGDEPALTGMSAFEVRPVYVGNDQSDSRGMPPAFLPHIGTTTLH